MAQSLEIGLFHFQTRPLRVSIWHKSQVNRITSER